MLMKLLIVTLSVCIMLQRSQTLFAQKQVNDAADLSWVIENYYTGIEDLDKVYIFKDSPEYFDRFDAYYRNGLKELSALPFTNLNSLVDLLMTIFLSSSVIA